MIVFYNDQDKEELKRIDEESTRKLQEIEALIEKLRPGDTGPEEPERNPVIDPETGETDPGYEEQYAKEMERCYTEWLAAGSPEWREARMKRSQLIDERSEAFHSFNLFVEQREFSKIAGDREKIIESAKEQINLVINGSYKSYELRASGKDEAGDDITGFSGYDLRVDGRRFYLDTETIIVKCKGVLRLHLEDRAQDPEALQEINNLILTIVTDSPKTSSDKGELGAWYKVRKRKPRTLQKSPVFSNTDTFSYFSTTPLKDTLVSILSNEGSVEKTAKSINKVSKGAVVGFRNKDDKDGVIRAIKVETDNSSTLIELLGSVFDNPNCQPTKKILHFIEAEIYKSIYYKGHMNDDVVQFPLRSMVNKKLYANENNARRAFNEAKSILTAIRISASLRTGKEKFASMTDSEDITAVLFPTMKIKNGLCFVRLNPDINWIPYFKDFVLMPDSWYALPDNAADLEFKIFRILRQNKSKIDKNGILVVNIKLSSVAEWLNLPRDTKNPKRNVKDKIETALAQIANSLDKKSFLIDLITDLNAPLEDYLSGYLRITARGIYTENLVDLANKQQARIEKAIARKDEIVQEASIRKLAEAMKEES